MEPIICPECQSIMVLRETYKFRYRKSRKPRKYYSCSRYPQCRSAHGAHPDGRPLGHPASRETRSLRSRVHELLRKKMPHSTMNAHSIWLASHGLKRHCGDMTREDCLQAIDVLRKEIGLKMYAIHPGYAMSAFEGREVYLSALELADRYGLRPDDWIEWRNDPSLRKSDFIHLYPPLNGVYRLP